MPTTLFSLLVAVAAVLPGFVTVELTQRQRAVQAGNDAQSVVLRALFYALLIHLAWSSWTWRLVQDLSGAHWQRHLGELVTWTLVVLIACGRSTSWGIPSPNCIQKEACGSPGMRSPSCTS